MVSDGRSYRRLASVGVVSSQNGLHVMFVCVCSVAAGALGPLVCRRCTGFELPFPFSKINIASVH